MPVNFRRHQLDYLKGVRVGGRAPMLVKCYCGRYWNCYANSRFRCLCGIELCIREQSGAGRASYQTFGKARDKRHHENVLRKIKDGTYTTAHFVSFMKSAKEIPEMVNVEEQPDGKILFYDTDGIMMVCYDDE